MFCPAAAIVQFTAHCTVCSTLCSIQRIVQCTAQCAVCSGRYAAACKKPQPGCALLRPDSQENPVPLCFFNQAGLEEVVLLLRDISPVTKA